jgi:hypothetical protein
MLLVKLHLPVKGAEGLESERRTQHLVGMQNTTALPSNYTFPPAPPAENGPRSDCW